MAQEHGLGPMPMSSTASRVLDRMAVSQSRCSVDVSRGLQIERHRALLRFWLWK
jgi:hypothetical protein